jgi:dihydroorotase (multifunctional complex type)
MAQFGLVFPGQGSQYSGMGQDLYRGDQSVRTLFADAGAVLERDMASLCFEGPQETLDLTVNTQISVLTADLAAWRAFSGRVAAAPLVMAGHSLGEYAALHAAGAVGLRDVLMLVQKRALYHQEAVPEGEGAMAAVIGLPCEAVDVMSSRDLRLAEATGGRLHLLNISSANSVELIRRVKARGVYVTAGVCPHHLTLTDECLRTFDSNFKVNPPLRSAEHVEMCIQGLVDGTLDVISSGHAPRASEKKMLELNRAPFGAVGLETCLGVILTKLVVTGRLDWMTALAKLTINPARILGIPKGTLQIGADADITVIDPDLAWTVDPDQFRSKSKNTTFAGWQLQGRAVHVFVGGDRKP